MSKAILNAVPVAMQKPSKFKIFPLSLLFVPIALICLILCSPMLAIIGAWNDPQVEVWQHLIDTQLLYLLGNTGILMLGVGIGVVCLGVCLAWMTSVLDFPGRSIFEWALILPLAMPAYVMGFVYLGLFDYTGAVPTWFRQELGIQLPSIRSPLGVVWVMIIVLYPYVYMLARSAFLSQGQVLMNAARTLGIGPWGAFWRVALPLARPGIVAGTSLALMETLADFGTVSIFNFDTFTTAIYKSWYGLFNLQAAAQLASLLLLIVAVSLSIERWTRGNAQFSQNNLSFMSTQRYTLKGVKAWGLTLCLTAFFSVVFLIPLFVLGSWAVERWTVDFDARMVQLIVNTLSLGGIACVLTLLMAGFLAFSKRRHQTNPVIRQSIYLSTLGYALPGSVLAIGVMLVFAYLDRQTIDWLQTYFNYTGGQLFLGSVGALIFAYVVRFLAPAFGSLDTGLGQIKPSLHEAAQGLGAGRWRIFYRIYLKLLRPSMLTGMLIVLVDVMKEMPATLLLRPFGWDTLAVRIYEMTSEGEWERAALPAIVLVIAGLLPVILLIKKSRHVKRSRDSDSFL